MKALPVLVVLGLFVSQGWAGTSVRECAEKPDFRSRGRVIPNTKSLPPIFLVARKAQYHVENKVTGHQILGEHIFNKGNPRIVCADAGFPSSRGFSIYAPTLINLSDQLGVEDVYWQFHLVAGPKQFGIWNRRSLIFSKATDLHEGLSKTGARAQFFQTAHDQFELALIREDGSWTETLSVQYDGLLRIP
jgi:hypothetical protein